MPGSFYTRGGDDGHTGVLGKGRVSKDDLRVEALGAVDEANAALGVARALSRLKDSADLLLQVQRDLYGLMGELAATAENVERFHVIGAERVEWLEHQVDDLAAQVEVPGEFIVPGDTPEGAFFDLARTIVRRAERRVAALLRRGDVSNTELLRYLNRLSSLCFLLELREHAAAAQGAGGSKITFAKTDKETGEEK